MQQAAAYFFSQGSDSYSANRRYRRVGRFDQPSILSAGIQRLFPHPGLRIACKWRRSVLYEKDNNFWPNGRALKR
jgi:hypothetical protein